MLVRTNLATLQQSPKELNLKIDIYDEVGIGGAASGISGGLLHPYSPKGTTFLIFHLQLLSLDVMAHCVEYPE